VVSADSKKTLELRNGLGTAADLAHIQKPAMRHAASGAKEVCNARCKVDTLNIIYFALGPYLLKPHCAIVYVVDNDNGPDDTSR